MTERDDSPPSEPAKRRVARLVIEGRVQGVFFRNWTIQTATKLGLDGWVRNLTDGRVEAVAAGPPDHVDRLIAACHEGPERSLVTAVSVEEAGREDDPGTGGFGKRATT